MKTQSRMLSILLIFAVATLAFAGGAQEADGDKMVIREVSQVPNIITPGSWDGQSFAFNASVYDFLVEIDPETSELMPTLATEWSTEEGKVWTVKLREGVTFHDGSPFTSEDVRFTVERTQDPDLGHLQKSDFEIVERIETPDDYTIVFHLEEVRPTFMYLFTSYNMCVLASDYDYAEFGETRPMGTGPFKVEQYIPKESVLMSANEDYWLDGHPIADELVIYFIADMEASVAMLEAGEVDVVSHISTIHKENLERQGFEIAVPWQENRVIAMAADREPFDDNRVRLAMKYAMDPTALARACQGRLGEDVYYTESPILNFQLQYHDIPHRGQDIERARELLAEAGYPNGLEVELYYASDHPYSSEIAQTVKELAAPAGFDIVLKGYTRDIYLSQHWMNVPMSITGWGPRVEPSMLLSLAYHSEGPWNESHLDDPEVDELIDMIRTEIDQDQRLAYYEQLQEVFYERGTMISVEIPFYVGMRSEVRNYRQPPTFMTQYEYVSIEE